MTKDKAPESLKEQLEILIARMEARFAVKPESDIGYDWWQLSEEEEQVFKINRSRFPRMVTTYECYEVFKLLSDAPQWDEKLVEQEL